MLQDDAQDSVVRRGGVPEVVGPVLQGELLEGEFILQGVRLHRLDLTGGALGNAGVDQYEPPNTEGVYHAHPHDLLVARDPFPVHMGGIGEGEGGRLVVVEGAGHAEGVAQRLDGRPIQVSENQGRTCLSVEFRKVYDQGMTSFVCEGKEPRFHRAPSRYVMPL